MRRHRRSRRRPCRGGIHRTRAGVLGTAARGGALGLGLCGLHWVLAGLLVAGVGGRHAAHAGHSLGWWLLLGGAGAAAGIGVGLARRVQSGPGGRS